MPIIELKTNDGEHLTSKSIKGRPKYYKWEGRTFKRVEGSDVYIEVEGGRELKPKNKRAGR